jgi:peptide/nickel transport system permease protein
LIKYALRRLLLALPTLLGITLVVFLIINMAPGDPASLKTSEIMDPRISGRIHEMLVKQFGLDRPVHERYLKWLWDVCRGDLGISFSDSRSVADKIAERLFPTICLSFLAIVGGLVTAIPIGILQARRQNGWFDHLSGLGLYILYAIPSYVGAILLIYFVGARWDLLPFRGMESDNFADLSLGGKAVDYARHFALITIAYTYGSIAFNARFVRGNLLEVLRQDFVRTARAKGLDERTVLLKHAFRNTLIPLLTRLGMILPALISGSVILEVLFNWPGIGRLFFDAILARDYPVVMAESLVTAVLVLGGILISDLSYAWADPRISYE